MDRSTSAMFGRLFVIALCSVAVLAGCSNRRSDQHRSQADIYLRQGNLEKAESNYRKAITTNSENALAHFGLGRTLSLDGKLEDALGSFDQAIAIDPSLAQAYERAAEVQVLRSDVPGALNRAIALTEIDGEAGTLLHALVLRGAMRPGEAIATIREFVEERSDSPRLKTSLALSYLQAGMGLEAEQELASLLDGPEPNSFPLHVLLLESYHLQGKNEQMVQGLRDLAEERPEDARAQLHLAHGLLETGEVDEALAIATPFLEQAPQSGPANYIVGSCLIVKNDLDNAVKHLTIAQEAYPNAKGIAQRLAIARSGGSLTTEVRTPNRPVTQRVAASGWRELWDLGSFQKLLDNRNSLTVSEAEETLYQEALALTALFSGDFALAKELGAALDPASPVLRYINSTQSLLEGRINQEDATEIQDALAAWEPGDDNDRALMKANAQGFLLARMGLRAQAYSILSNTLRKWPENGVAWRNLATLYQLASMPKHRVASLRQLLATKGTNAETLGLLVDALVESGMIREAQTFVESTFALMPDDAETIAYLAQAYIRANSIPLAIKTLEESSTNQPDLPVLAITLAEARLRAGNAQGALDALDAVNSSSLAAVETGAFAEAHLGNWDRVLERMRSAADEALSLNLRLLKVAALLYIDRPSEALAALPADEILPGANLNNTVAESVAILGSALGQKSNLPDERAEQLAAALRRSSSGAKLFAFALARQDAQFYEHAYASFDELYAELNDQPRLLTSVFDNLSKAGGIENRPAIGEALAAADETWPESWLGLAKIYGAEDDVKSQQNALTKATALAPDSTLAWQHLAEFASQQNDEALSLIVYEKLLVLEPENPVVLNNLAYFILETDGDPQQALEYAAKANEAVGGVSAFMHTLGLAQLRVGDLESSQTNLMRALTMQPGDPTLTLDFGQLLIELGRVEDGKKAVESALTYANELNLDFPRASEAASILAEN